MMSSVSHGRTVKSAFLVILMIIMTQVGYLDLINSPRTGNDSFDDDSSAMETGSSSSNDLTSSIEGADLIIGEAMEDITFQYNSSATSGSNAGTYNGNGTAWLLHDIEPGSGSSNPGGFTAFGDKVAFHELDVAHGTAVDVSLHDHPELVVCAAWYHC